MWWLKELYLGKSVQNREKEIRRALRRNALITDVYLLALSLQEQEQIDIFPAAVLLQHHFPRQELHVFGLAGEQSEALDIVTHICEETYEATGGADMRSYLSAMKYVKSRR